MSEIWFRDILGFLKVTEATKFIPSAKMNLTEKLNSIVRLSAYVSIIHFTIFQDSSIFSLFILALLSTFIYYKHVEEMYSPSASSDDRYAGATTKTKKGANEGKLCTKPKDNNPFMNVLINEYSENPTRGEACDVDDKHVKHAMDEKYFKDIYRDIDDAFDKKSSFRNFYTMPNTSIPNNQREFAEWLYGSKELTQKEGNGNRNKLFASYY